MKEAIKDWSGKILGWIETMPNGDKKATDFGGKILGYYKKQSNYTTDFYGKLIYQGDAVVSFITNQK